MDKLNDLQFCLVINLISFEKKRMEDMYGLEKTNKNCYYLELIRIEEKLKGGKYENLC